MANNNRHHNEEEIKIKFLFIFNNQIFMKKRRQKNELLIHKESTML